MPVERRGWVIAFEIGSTGNGRNPIFNGRQQPSCGGASRMTRECQVRICERLGVKFPGAYSANPAVISALASGLLLPQSMTPNWPGPAVMVGSPNRLGCVRIGATCSRGRRLSCRLASPNWFARTCFQTSSLVIQRVTDRCVGDQPRSAAALPRTRLFEPSENTAMFRPQAAIASSADQDCAAP